jgi:GNAT superfamily N-acetyltransferase
VWEIERFDKSRHDRSQFDCGNAVLTEWLQKRASQWDRKDLSRTYVAVKGNSSQVLGYYSLSSHAVEYESLDQEQTRGLPRIDVPVVLLGRLAVDRSQQGCGLGRFLLLNALSRIVNLADAVGIRAIEVDAIDDSAKRFYLKYGFSQLADDDRHLFLSIGAIKQLNLPAPD